MKKWHSREYIECIQRSLENGQRMAARAIATLVLRRFPDDEELHRAIYDLVQIRPRREITLSDRWITDGTTPEVDDDGISASCLVSVREVLPDQGTVLYVTQADYNADDAGHSAWIDEHCEIVEGVYAWAKWPEPWPEPAELHRNEVERLTEGQARDLLNRPLSPGGSVACDDSDQLRARKE